MKTKLLSIVLTLSSTAAIAKPVDVWMNLFLLTADLSKVTESDLDRLVALGAKGIEFPGTISTPEDCRRLGRYIRAHRLGAGLNVAVDKNTDPSALEETGRNRGIAYLKSRIDCAADIGASVLAGPIILPWGAWPEGLTGDALRKRLKEKEEASIKSMRELGDYAASKGIKLAYEPLTRWEMPGLNTLSETIEYLKVLNHPNVGVTLDSSHEVLDGDGPSEYARQVAWLHANKKIFYIQASAPHRGEFAKSWLPWKEFFGPLKRVWKGPIAVEIMNAVPPFAQPDGQGLRLVRAPFADPFAVAQEAMSLVQSHWGEAK